MPDTVRTVAALLTTILQDGQVAGSITPQDIRDLLVSLAPVSLKAKAYGLVEDGTTDDRTALHNLVNTTMQPNGGTVQIEGTVRIASALTIPANVQIYFGALGKIKPDTGITVNILAFIQPDWLRQVFDVSAASSNVRAWLGNEKRYMPEWWGASNGATGAVNYKAIMAAWYSVADDGGTLAMFPRRIYPVGSRLDFRNAVQANREHQHNIEGNNCVFDFIASSIPDLPALVQLGATTLANAAEQQKSTIRNFRVLGPEVGDNIAPKTNTNPNGGVGGGVLVATTTLGVRVEYGTNLNLENLQSTHCRMGFEYYWCWDSSWKGLKAYKCLIGHHIDTGCTMISSEIMSVTDCSWGILIQGGSVAIGDLRFDVCRIEDCTVGVHIDGGSGSNGREIWSVCFRETYFEDIYYDGFRIGTTFDPDPANILARGADRTEKIPYIHIEGGSWVGDGVVAGFGTNRKYAAFASTPNVHSAMLRIPAMMSDCLNLPYHTEFHTMAGMIAGTGSGAIGQNQDHYMPGDAVFRVNSTGTATFDRGNTAAVPAAKISTGIYEVYFRKAYSSDDRLIAHVTSRSPTATNATFCRVDDTLSNTSKLSIEVRDAAGALTDAGFMCRVSGQLAAL